MNRFRFAGTLPGDGLLGLVDLLVAALTWFRRSDGDLIGACSLSRVVVATCLG
jgi:hypothetical protein